MTKFFFFVIMALFVAHTSHCQNAPKKLVWGYKIGMNASNLRIENTEDAEWKTGLATGLFFNCRLADKFSLQPELLYSSMGAKMNGTSLRLNYFAIPVLAKYRLCKNFSVLAGPEIDMLIQAKTKSSSNQFAKVTDNYKESSFNLTGGIEYWPFHCFGFSARYIYGLNNIVNYPSADMKNQGVQLMAAVKF